jgi:hypothetical protein
MIFLACDPIAQPPTMVPSTMMLSAEVKLMDFYPQNYELSNLFSLNVIYPQIF